MEGGGENILLSHGPLETYKMNRIFIIMLGANIPCRPTSASVELIFTKIQLCVFLLVFST